MKENVEQSGNPSKETLQLVIFTLSKEEFGVEISKVKEVIRMPDITKIPHVPHYIEGIMNLRSSIIPVINLAKKFGLDYVEKTDDSCIMVVEIGSQVAGMVVDAVTEVLRMPNRDIEPAPEVIVSSIAERYIRGVGKVNDRLLILLDVEQVFTDQQKKQISQLKDAGAIPA